MTYKAMLIDKSGKVIGTSASTVESKEETNDPGEPSLARLSGDALESMYEAIAEDLLKAPAPATNRAN